MSTLDWIVLSVTQLFIIGYGIWKSRRNKNIQGYLLGNREMNGFAVALSIMATQASAITFLSAPGQAYTDGMRFIQIYLGLPIAMIILSVTAVPIYHRLKVYTAYEYLEKRFDVRTGTLASVLFLSQRGLAAGFTVFAPSLVLSSLLGWNIYQTNLIIGSIVVIYTVIGGTRAVSQTQKIQMAVILFGMFTAGYLVVKYLPENVTFLDAVNIAGKTGKLNAVDFTFDLNNRYTIWTGMLGGLFLMLSYFGTDQSQVQRYLGGSSVKDSRNGLLINGMVKIPMQFMILFIGAMVFVFYSFNTPPVSFNKVLVDKALSGPNKEEFINVQSEFEKASIIKQEKAFNLLDALHAEDETAVNRAAEELNAAEAKTLAVREKAKEVILKADENADTNDTNYIFLNFVIDFLPIGLVGLLISVIFSASMSSTSAELNALASTTVINIYKRFIKKSGSERHYLRASKLITVFWGIYAILFAMFANRLGTLIEAVNILGSLVYGTILGIFLAAFYFKKIGGSAVFLAAVFAELIVLYFFGSPYISSYLYSLNTDSQLVEAVNFLFKDEEVAYLWYNLIGCVAVIVFALLFSVRKKS